MKRQAEQEEHLSKLRIVGVDVVLKERLAASFEESPGCLEVVGQLVGRRWRQGSSSSQPAEVKDCSEEEEPEGRGEGTPCSFTSY